jgi:hypothetical protein
MILDGNSGAVITICTNRKIRRKQRMGGVEAISIFSEPKEKVYRILFLKRRWLADNDCPIREYKGCVDGPGVLVHVMNKFTTHSHA